MSQQSIVKSRLLALIVMSTALVALGLAAAPAEAQTMRSVRTANRAMAQPMESMSAMQREIIIGPDGVPVDSVDDITLERYANPSVSHSTGIPVTQGDCGGCGTCAVCKRHAVWFRADYLVWRNDPLHLPALVTTSPDDGVLPDANLLLGREDVPDDSRNGGRIDIGLWLDDCKTLGIGATYWALDDQDFSYHFQSDGTPLLARPFFDFDDGESTSLVVASPDISGATIDVDISSDISGGDVYFRGAMQQSACGRLDYIVGYQYGSFNERFRMQTVIDFTGEIFPEGQQTTVSDSFATENDFNGVTFGLLRECDYGVWGIRMLAKLGLGNMRQRARISGSTVTIVPGQTPIVSESGFLAAETNEGSYERNEFAAVPELGFSLTRQLTCNTDFTMGYSLIYFSDVARSADQIDTLNHEPVIGATRPDFAFDSDGLLLQGVNFGVQWRR